MSDPLHPPGKLESDDSPAHLLAPWFAQWRGDREARRTAPNANRRRALITIVSNEPVFLPIWLRYYSRFFAPQDIYVIDTDPGAPTAASGVTGFVHVPEPHVGLDNLWMVSRVQALQHELLQSYDVVLVCDVDEIVALAPRWGTLDLYLDRFAEKWVNCLGYELLHMRDSEPPLDLDQPIMAQRRHWYINDGYNKPSIATVPMYWRPGFHGREDFHMRPDPDLRLVHLHRIDYDICRARHQARARLPWAELDAAKRWGVQNFITDEPEFGNWFYNDSCFPGHEIRPERIPATWRNLF